MNELIKLLEERLEETYKKYKDLRAERDKLDAEAKEIEKNIETIIAALRTVKEKP